MGLKHSREAAVALYCLAGDKDSMKGAREAAFAMIFVDSRPSSNEQPRTLELRDDIISGELGESDTLPAAVRYLTIAARLGSMQACWAGMKLAKRYGNSGVTNVLGWRVWAEHVNTTDDGMTALQHEELHEMIASVEQEGGARSRLEALQIRTLGQIERFTRNE